MVGSYQTRGITSLCVVFLIVFSILLTSVVPFVNASEIETYAYVENQQPSDANPLSLDKYSFLETICGMFNCFYAPEGLCNSGLSSWNDITIYSSAFNFILFNLEYIYNQEITVQGFQTLDSSLDNYVTPYLWSNGSAASDSIYNVYISDGYLDFESSLGINEYVLIRESFNKFIKLMYDYNYNLDDYSIVEIANSVPLIPLTFDGTTSNLYLGYGLPSYYLSSHSDFIKILPMQVSFIKAYSEEGYNTNDYIAKMANVTSSSDEEINSYRLYSTYLDYTDLSNFHIMYRSSGTSSYICYFMNQCVTQSFTKTGFNNYTKYEPLTTTINTTNNNSTASYSSSNCKVGYKSVLSPKIGYYSVYSGDKFHNWGKDLITGTNEAWRSYSSFTGVLGNKFYTPSTDDVNELISGVAKGEDCSSIVDYITNVPTGYHPDSEDKEDEIPSIDIDGIINGIMGGGDFSEGNAAVGDFNDILNDYNNAEAGLKDYTNLDSVKDTLWNTANIAQHANDISQVSTHFITIWESFGPYVTLFMLALALGLVAFLLKI